MKAAVLKDDNNFLVIENLDTPEIKPDEILVAVKACGVCHTDLHYIDHGIRTFKPKPIILGHEASGVVSLAGSAVDIFKAGDRVVVPAVMSCGSCKMCLRGKSNICLNMKMPGNHINGAYAEYIAVPAKDVAFLPDDFSFETGALVADAFSTAYHAVVDRAHVIDNLSVMVIGCGGVGSAIVQIAGLITSEVTAVDINVDRLNFSKQFGAKYSINPVSTDLVEFTKTTYPLGVDIIFEASGTQEGFLTAVKLLKSAGKLVIVGYNNDKVLLNTAKIMFMEQDIIGSLGSPPDKIPEIFNFIKKNNIDMSKFITNKRSLDEINLALDDLRASQGLRSIIIF